MEENSLLEAVVRRFTQLNDRVVFFGESPAVRAIVEDMPGFLLARTWGDLSGILGDLARNSQVSHVTFLGGLEEAVVAEAVARERGLGFTAQPPSLFHLLAGLVPEPLAKQLAVGLEEQAELGSQL